MINTPAYMFMIVAIAIGFVLALAAVDGKCFIWGDPFSQEWLEKYNN